MYQQYGYWNIDQNQWPLESFIDIYKKLNRIQKSSILLTERIQNVLAMFIIYEMPLDHCLKNQELIAISKMIRSDNWSNLFEPHLKNYSQIIKPINGFKGGKIIKNNQVIWGYSLDDWIQDQQNFSYLKPSKPKKI